MMLFIEKTLFVQIAVLLWMFGQGDCSLLTKKLVRKLLHGEDPYNRHIRPVINESTPIELEMQLFVSQILDMDERLQQLKANVWVTYDWIDEFLRWDPEDFDGLKSFKLTSDLIWMPDIVLYNNAADSYEPYMFNKIVKIDYDGHVNWGSPHIIQASCQLDIANFPFDYQHCPIKFGPWQHDGSDLILTGAGDDTVYRSDGEWDMIGLTTVTNLKNYPDTPGFLYYDVTYTIHIRRRSMYYVFNLLVPCMLIASITLMGFLLPVDSGEKVSLGITVLLSLTVFLLLIAQSMPPSSVVPVIGHYYVSTMVLVSISILLTVSVINLHHRGPYCRPAPQWVRTVVLGKLAWLLRLQPDRFKHMAFGSKKNYYNANGVHASSTGNNNFRKSVEKRPGYKKSESMKISLPNQSPIRGVHGRDGRAACRDINDDQLILLRRMNDHMRYIRDHFAEISDAEEIRDEWKQIALVIDRVFAIFYVLGTIGTIMILVSSLSSKDHGES